MFEAAYSLAPLVGDVVHRGCHGEDGWLSGTFSGSGPKMRSAGSWPKPGCRAFRLPRWPAVTLVMQAPSPARILNHIQKKRGIPKDSVRLEIALAGLICLQQPTHGMTLEASKAGRVEIDGESYDRLQIRTIAEMLEGRGFDTPTKVKPFNWIRQGELDV